MIAVDTSVLIAVVQLEAEADAFTRCMETAGAVCLSAVSLQEALTVLAGRRGEAVWPMLEQIIARLEIEVVAHDATLARVASQAFLRFGKGRHPARLNFADCAAYALAKSRGISLLFKGADFAQTDIVAALPTPA